MAVTLVHEEGNQFGNWWPIDFCEMLPVPGTASVWLMLTHHKSPLICVALPAVSTAATAAAGPGFCQPAKASAVQHEAGTLLWLGSLTTHLQAKGSQ